MSQPKLSVVTVSYNCDNIIEETIKSVVSQDYCNLEYIIIDGKSTDSTLDVIHKYDGQISFLLSEKDRGIFDAMNKSLQFVSGDYVLFLNAGDKFVNNHVLSDVCLQISGSPDLIYGDTYNQTKYGYQLRKGDDIYSKRPSKHDLVMKSQGICHQSLFTKASILKKIRFNTSYPIGADYDTTARVYFEGNHQIINVGFPISVFDDRYGGFSHNKYRTLYEERCKMFGYKLSLMDKLSINKLIFVSSIKRRISSVFPTIEDRVRSKKYQTNI